MIVYVRHAETASNQIGHEKIRSHLPVPLDQNGMAQAEEISHALANLDDVKAIWCGTSVRVVQTAMEIAEALGMTLTPLEELNTWDMGDWAGRLVKEMLPKIHAAIDKPNTLIPGGQTFQQWLNQTQPKVKEAVESDDLYVVVASGRIGGLLLALSENDGEYPAIEVLKRGAPVDPIGVIVVRKDWKILYKSARSAERAGDS